MCGGHDVDPRKQFVDRCRAALRDAGWSVSEAPGWPIRVTAERQSPPRDPDDDGYESVVIGHPAGLVATYERLCRLCRVAITMG